MTFAGSFGGRLSWSFFCANAPTDTTPSIAITSNSRISLIIFSLFSSCHVLRRREKEMRRTERQQDRCHVILAAKSNKIGRNSHGFELSRTLSCAKATKKNSHKEAKTAHKAQKTGGTPISHNG